VQTFLLKTKTMKKILLNLFLIFPIVLLSQVTTNPSPIEVDQLVTITIDANSNATDCNGFSNPSKVYAHLGVGDDNDEYGTSVVGNWGQDDGVGEMTNLGSGLWSITFTPNTYFGLSAAQESNVTKMGMVFRNEDGSQELKANGCANFIYNIGAFQVNMINPANSDNGILVVNSGGGTQILSTNTNGPANYALYVNGNTTPIHTQNNTTFYSGYLFSNLTENQYCELVVTQGSSSITKTFMIVVNTTINAAVPSGMVDGINYHSSDDTKATLVLNAPGKDFVYVAGSFNSYTPTSVYAMKQDATSGKFWFELSGLTSGDVETYQYWVGDLSPVTDSPKLVKTADPFSTLVLSPFDDPWISESTFPGLSTTYSYPSGQDREVTVLQTGQTAYNWQVTNFTKPKKEDLVIYEVLIRDFDTDRNFQDLIDKIDYFKDLNINAIELMPIMEYEGNESWGYNTAFHMALDKFYGTEDKFKEFVDLCHQNGIAVILDVALNHAFGRNPMNRMWMDDPDNDGWGEPSSENPYMNQVATHSYSVGSDFNHQSPETQYYVERVIERWINDFKIDGFRWDLTKGFTQNATGSDSQTNAYQADRVAVLKDYADHSWSLDNEHYVIFEHLGGDSEESEWANYRLGEGKGIMMWSEMFNSYKNLAQGQSSSVDISRIGHTAHSGFSGKRVVGYPESHDKDRLMYEMVTYGQSGISGNLNASLNRMSAIGAVFLTVPGPKMLWHFAELGMDNSIFTCQNGTVNTDYDATSGDCKLDTKPQPQWANNWLADANRSAIYNDWARLNYLKINEDVFEGNYSINTNTQTPKIYIWDDTLPSTSLKNVVVISNFTTSTQNVNPNFPYGGIWYDLMDETGGTTISGTTTSVSLASGEFKIYGNAEALLSNEDIIEETGLKVYPNPTQNAFFINQRANTVQVYDITGKLVKVFNGNFAENYAFDISNLTNSIYIVKLTNELGIQHTTKLIKL